MTSAEEREDLDVTVRHVVTELGADALPHSEVFLQLWNLGPSNGGNLLQKYKQVWQPEFGMGLWPNRPPPEGWTETSLMDNAAAVLLGEEPEMPNHRVLRLAGEEKEVRDSPHILRGLGTLIETRSPLPYSVRERQARNLLQPRITDPRFSDEPFYWPLFDGAALAAAATLEELDDWMCGNQCYIRESASDGGVLVVFRAEQ